MTSTVGETTKFFTETIPRMLLITFLTPGVCQVCISTSSYMVHNSTHCRGGGKSHLSAWGGVCQTGDAVDLEDRNLTLFACPTADSLTHCTQAISSASIANTGASLGFVLSAVDLSICSHKSNMVEEKNEDWRGFGSKQFLWLLRYCGQTIIKTHFW